MVVLPTRRLQQTQWRVSNDYSKDALVSQVKSSQVAFNEWVWQSHKLTIKIQLINVQTQKNIAQKHIAQNTWEKNNYRPRGCDCVDVVGQSGDEVAGAGSWKEGVKGTEKGNDW